MGRSARHLAVHVQVGLMGLALLGLMLLVVAVGVGVAVRVEGAIQGVAGRDVPTVTLLLELERGTFDAQLALEQSFDNEDLHVRDERLGAYADNRAALERGWEAFGATAPLDRGEARLRRSFEADRAAWADATVVLATLSRQQVAAGDPETQELLERSRWGGEEFVALLPACEAENAKQAIDRTREALVRALSGASLPAFTVSFGVADSRQGEALDELLAIADGALLAAKRAGRDQVVMAGAEPPGKDDAEDEDCDAGIG